MWLEDTKIRQYKIEERAALRSVNDAGWEAHLHKVCMQNALAHFMPSAQYLDDVACPRAATERASLVDWLLTLAVTLEYSEDGCIHHITMIRALIRAVETFATETGGAAPDMDGARMVLRVLLTAAVSAREAVAAVHELAALLHVPHSDDSVQLLKACGTSAAPR